MLKTLYIENIAVIEKTTIDFSHGLNVLTGETGAGKSIIIDAINAIMGQRTSKDIIRTGESSAFVSAQFEDINMSAQNALDELGFTLEDDVLIVQRTLSQSGKNVCKINGRPATVSMLRELSKHLINIHGQHESYELFSPETHLGYIDSYGGCGELILDYRAKYNEFKILQKKLNEANTDESERLREMDLLQFQSKELFEADIQIGEEERLEAERTALMNVEKIASLLNKARMMLDGEDSDGGVESVDIAASAMQSAASYNSEYEELSNNLTDIYYNLRDCAEGISDAIDNLENDPARLEEIEERFDLLNRLTRKYNCPADELPDLAEQMQSRLEELLNYDKNRDDLIDACEKAEAEAFKKAEELSAKRQTAAKTFAANPGETPRPVAKIASGGELSRMMLAIKTVLAATDDVDTLIFDEVDTGISGSAAEKVGLKLKEVSKDSQVLCVTHQAQIAALADYHYLIDKRVDSGRTFTVVTELDRDARVRELARIIGGVNITQAAISHAEDMLGTNG